MKTSKKWGRPAMSREDRARAELISLVQTQFAILGIMATHAGPFTASYFDMAGINKPWRTLVAALSALVEEGRIRRVSRALPGRSVPVNHYELVPDAERGKAGP